MLCDHAEHPSYEQIYQDIQYIICLTYRNLLLTRTLIDERAQLAQPIGPE